MKRLPLITLFLVLACGSGEETPAPGSGSGTGEPTSRAAFPARMPAEYSRDILLVEGAAASIRASLERTLVAGLVDYLAQGDERQLGEALAPNFRGRPPRIGTPLVDGTLAGILFEPGAGEPVGGEAFRALLLKSLAPLALGGPGGLDQTGIRGEIELTRLFLEPAGEAALAQLRLGLFSPGPNGLAGGNASPGGRTVDVRSLTGEAGGLNGEAGGRTGGRALWRLEGRAQLLLGPTGWRLGSFDTSGGRRLRGLFPPLVERTLASGLVVDTDPEMKRLMQVFKDRHVTLALGGLTVTDWDGDGFLDVLQTSRGQSARLFLNDGRGGFLPGELPCSSPGESGSFALVVDLDGDRRAELVTSRILEYGPGGARLGVYTRTGSGWRALDSVLLPVPRGLRRVAIQTVVPLDANGDGLLDLFLGVYGDMHSRGEDYNTVEAYDGADNYLLMNRGGLNFEEVSAVAGISGTQYTYVAEAFDFDGDGDTDIFEGNDFGPNILWQNDGRGSFKADEQSVLAGVSAYTMGVTLGDPAGNGDWYMYISNMSAAEGMRSAPLAAGLDSQMRAALATIASGNMLYRRDRESGVWSEVTAGSGSAEAGWAWGCVFWDGDNDGDRDLMVTNGFTSHSRRDLGDWNSLYWRQVAADAGFLARGERTRDVNRGQPFEGSFSGYQRDRYFHNLGEPGRALGESDSPALRFEEAAYLLGLDGDHDGRCVVPADIDGDGDQDLVLWTL
ncbi:MAG: VCBS repeat-containing protein, partial [Planctomycetota bacterium]|nr:VCBS repeat-containing protein [Planctomycetota bacterium]